jgi:HlyD family secretion protein
MVSEPLRDGPLASTRGPFRQTALARLNNPEQLDRLLTVTTSRSWIALAAFLLLILTAVAWSLIGTLPTYATGRGLMINQGGYIQDATAPGPGTLAEIFVKLGDEVTKGQIIARLVSPSTKEQMASARELVAERTDEAARQRAEAAAEQREMDAGYDRRRGALRQLEAAAKIRADQLQAKLEDEEALLKENVVTRSTVLSTQAERDGARQQTADAAAQLAEINSRSLDQKFQIGRRVKAAEYDLAEAQRKLNELVTDFRSGTEVRAPATGRVDVIRANLGDRLNRGDGVLTVETPGQHLEFLLFVSIREGGKIKIGQPVTITPNGVVREEEGTMLGVVASVSRFAFDAEAIRILNEELVRSFTAAGPVFLAHVALELDPTTVSGYKWTSSKGAEVQVKAGSFATGDVLVKTQRPIGLVIPTLRRWAGI